MRKTTIEEARSIVLIGFMGCGKTTVGKRLANLLGYQFVDIDMHIETKAKMPIKSIFDRQGEPFFRALETEAVEELSAIPQAVISTGGGVVKSSYNMEILKRNCTVFYIQSSPEKLYANTLQDNSRPLLNTPDRLGIIRDLLTEREPLYAQYADYIIKADLLSVKEIANEMIQIILAN